MLTGVAASALPQRGTAKADSPVTITFMNDWGGVGETQFNVMIDAFNKSHPTIQVKNVVTQDIVTKFLTASTSGQAPDILWWDRWRTVLYAPKGAFASIDDMMKADGVSRNDFYQEALKELTWHGHLYGLPATVDARALFYNKRLFAQAGIKTPPTTWTALEQDAIKLTKRDGNKLVRAGLSMQDPGLFSMYVQQAGGHMVTANGSHTAFNSSAGLTTLNFWNRLLNKDKVYEVGFEGSPSQPIDGFATGKVAMTFTGPWQISTYKKYGSSLDFGIAPPPAGPSGAKASIMGGLGLVIPTASQHKQAAWTFMKWWLAQPQNALMWGKESYNIPGNLKAIQAPFYQNDPLWKPVLQTLQFAKVRPTYAGYSTMEEQALLPNLQLFMEGKQSAAKTLDMAAIQGTQVLQRDNGPQ